MCFIRFSTSNSSISAISLWADPVLTGLQWRPPVQVCVPDEAPINADNHGSFLCALETVTEATPCHVSWRSCWRKSAGSSCSRAACWCWLWRARGECSGRTTAPPEPRHGTVGHRNTFREYLSIDSHAVLICFSCVYLCAAFVSQIHNKYSLKGQFWRYWP